MTPVPRLVFTTCVGLLPMSGAFAAAPFHIGICVDSVSQSEDEIRGAEQLVKEYGDVSKGGMIKMVITPDDFMSQQETYIANLVSLSNDPSMKVIVTCQMVPGTAEAYKRIREKRPDILLLGAIPAEDPLVISKASDLVLDQDFITRGYTIPWIAKALGAKTFLHISFPRHMSYEKLARRRAIMESACKDLGIKFVYLSAPDPTSDVGTAGAQQFLLEKIPQWVNTYSNNGRDKVAIFSTNDAHMEPIIKRTVESSAAIFPEPCSPSPIIGFPAALAVDLSREKGDWPAIMTKVEKAMVSKGAKGRIGTWPFSVQFVYVAGLGELGKRVVEGKAKLTNPKDVIDALRKYSPGSSWNGGFYTDLNTSVKTRMFLVYMDTYVFGKGYMGTTKLTIPAKYYSVRK